MEVTTSPLSEESLILKQVSGHIYQLVLQNYVRCRDFRCVSDVSLSNQVKKIVVRGLFVVVQKKKKKKQY